MGKAAVFVAALAVSTALIAQDARPPQQSSAPPAPGVRFGRVLTASSVVAWGQYEARDKFQPGDVVWVYAETLGTGRDRHVNLVMHFIVSPSNGGTAYDYTATYDEPTGSPNWAGWRTFRLDARAPLGTYTLRVEVLNRATGEKGTRECPFTVVSAAAAVAAATSGPDDDEPATVAPLNALFEEAYALLGQRQYDEAIKAFRKGLKTGSTSPEGWWGLARAYEGLQAHKNVIESADKLLEFGRTARYQAIAHNLKGAALFARATSRESVSRDDLAKAEQEFRGALAADESFSMAHYNLGVALLKGNDDAGGIGELRAYLKAAPGGSAARNATSMIDNPRRAREEFAPDFSIVAEDGEYIDLQGLSGKVVVIDFWASWCEPCKMAIPVLKSVRKRYPADRVAMVSISVDQDADAWRAAMREERMPWSQCRDTAGRVARLFGVRPIPSTFVLDHEGIIRKRIVGYSLSLNAELDDAIRKALKQAGPR